MLVTAEKDPTNATKPGWALEMTFAVELDIATIAPNVMPPAAARFCAWVVASATKPVREQVCDWASCWETCVPTILNDSVNPLASLAMFCCSVVKLATVAFVFARGTGRLNTHVRPDMVPTFKASCKLLTPDKFAAVRPDPCKAATTSSRLALSPD